MYFSSASILPSNISILDVTVSLAKFCSTCAFERNPNIPIDVININTTTAMDRYVFNHQVALFQYLWSHTAVTSLPTSKAVPIMIIGTAAAANIATSPATE